jgi:hypothetical protein
VKELEKNKEEEGGNQWMRWDIRKIGCDGRISEKARCHHRLGKGTGVTEWYLFIAGFG